MRILVVGDGKVGHTVAEQLTREGHDVVIIDKNEDVLQRCEDTLDVLCIRGNGANARTLLDAGVEKADFVVAATASDDKHALLPDREAAGRTLHNCPHPRPGI